jgi:hypothetical protein
MSSHHSDCDTRRATHHRQSHHDGVSAAFELPHTFERNFDRDGLPAKPSAPILRAQITSAQSVPTFPDGDSTIVILILLKYFPSSETFASISNLK